MEKGSAMLNDERILRELAKTYLRVLSQYDNASKENCIMQSMI